MKVLKPSFTIFSAILLLSGLQKAYSQRIIGSINTTIAKDETPILYAYDGGVQLIILSEDELRYYRLNQSFQIESHGTASIKNIGFAPRLYEVNANRKNINLFFSRRDSSGLRCLTINTVGHQIRIRNCIEDWDNKTQLLGHYSVQDTACFIYSNGENEISLSTVVSGESVGNANGAIDPSIFTSWTETSTSHPQLSKCLIDQNFMRHYALPFTPIKFYHRSKNIYASIEDGFSTHIVSFSRKHGSVSQKTLNVELPTSTSLRGALSNSLIKGKNVYQGIMTANGLILQKSGLKTGDHKFNKFYTYHNCRENGSPVYLHNRGKEGSYEEAPKTSFEFHKDRNNRMMAIMVETRKGNDHVIVSEVEPLKGFENWSKTSTFIKPKEHSQKVNGLVQSFSLSVFPSANFNFQQAISYKWSSIGLSISSTGEQIENGTDPDFTYSKANVTYFKMKYSSMFASHGCLVYLNNYAAYCFYRKTKKQFFFTAVE